MLCVCRYYVSWRNASLNGIPLSDDALARLQLYAIPNSGRLQLDYVSYQVRCSFRRHWERLDSASTEWQGDSLSAVHSERHHCCLTNCWPHLNRPFLGKGW